MPIHSWQPILESPLLVSLMVRPPLFSAARDFWGATCAAATLGGSVLLTALAP